jgi:hypothetical protein
MRSHQIFSIPRDAVALKAKLAFPRPGMLPCPDAPGRSLVCRLSVRILRDGSSAASQRVAVSTDTSVVSHGTPQAGPSSSRAPLKTPSHMLALASGATCLSLLAVQIVSGWHVLHSNGLYTAIAAHKYVWANTLAAALVAMTAVAAPRRWRWLAVFGPGAYLLGVIVVTAIPGGQILGVLTALLTMAALFDTGERLLRRLGADSLSQIVPVAWLAGIGPWSLGTLVLGRLSLLRWWTMGILVVLFGTIGCVRLGARILVHRRSIIDDVGRSSLSLVSAGLILLTCGWAAIYTAAPEVQYDALYAKSYLPELWARSGHIGSLVQHVQFEITGWFQVLATYGHLLDGPSVGRYLQLLGLICAAVTIWWWGSRYGPFGPLAAVAVVVTPHLFWQASTADDDLLLALCALAFCIAIVDSVRVKPGNGVRGIAFALGLMAGSGPSLKLHLTPLFAFLLLGWVAVGRSSHSISRRLGYSVLGAAITCLPPVIFRWIDSGNPILPAYNNIFLSKYWLPVNEKMDFPFWPHPGTLAPITAIWKAVVQPDLMVEIAPPGAFGVLIGATVLAILFGWLGRDRSRATRVVWVSLLPSIVFWWVSFRYLRYLLPISFVSVALILMLTAGVSFKGYGRFLAILGAIVATIASFPVTISQFWNVPTHKPPVYAAIGHWKASSYEDAALTERPAMLAFNRLSPPDARVATTAFERGWLTQRRELYTLGYEVIPLMELHGPLPVTGDQALGALRRIGIDWILVNGAEPRAKEPTYLWQVLATHGKIEFSDLGWTLYRLVN